MSDADDDPFTPMAAAASQMHEMFLAYVEAGFTRDEALRLIIGIITAGIPKQGDE